MYIWSVVLFFVALFTKQNTITMVATLAAYDVIVVGRPIWPPVAFIRPYLPFGVMTAAYLWLRYILFGQVAREGALNARGLEDFRFLLDRHFRHVVAGDFDAPAIVAWLAVAVVVAVWIWTRGRAHLKGGPIATSRGLPRAKLTGTEGACFISGPSGGPLACCRLPSPATIHPATSISPPLAGPSSLRSRSKRHGTFVTAAIGIARSRPPRRSFCCSTSCRCTGLYRNGGPWLRSRRKSRAICATLRCPRRQEAWSSSARPDGVGSGRYLLPRVPRISGPISTIASSSFHRARSAAARRHGSRRHAARSRPGRQGPAATRRSRCGGTPTAARSFRPTAVDTPQLPVLIRSLLDMPRPDDLDNTLSRILDVLPARTQGGSRP